MLFKILMANHSFPDNVFSGCQTEVLSDIRHIEFAQRYFTGLVCGTHHFL